MGAAFLGKNRIAESQNILLKGIHKLKGHLDLHFIQNSLEVDGIVDRSLSGIQFPHIGHNPLRLRINPCLFLAWPLVLIVQSKTWI